VRPYLSARACIGALLLIIGLALILGWGQARAQAVAAREMRPGYVPGYLPRDKLPDSFALLPPPPAAGSPALALDEAVSRQTIVLRDTPRWRLATEDADLTFPHAAGTFACALGAPVTERDTPTLYRLLQRSVPDAALSTYAAKEGYKRPRPFMINDAPICTPDRRERLTKDGAYPSGHSAVGWAWALMLTEIAPDRSGPVLARGMAYGQSRVICNVHWQSDVDAGRIVGAAAVARLHADPAFRADLDAGKAELDAVRTRRVTPTNDCAAEDAALRSAVVP
jgi:acid phosphatase (class A)